ncbi:CAP domain-containing protein [Streptomyces sp. SP18CS02]|uniref:CAP domain-containing protein n=1 Tax=Streptomyces sp. SP18CS02 TaxID=3002531 RepID=UPI002E7A857B|nr:CAP domain-containing protein [Streptomyces sp. SP18CS02]MEE1752981.1 CAP domain-containing protein [Streptomyces sp. SP18CS02]
MIAGTVAAAAVVAGSLIAGGTGGVTEATRAGSQGEPVGGRTAGSVVEGAPSRVPAPPRPPTPAGTLSASPSAAPSAPPATSSPLSSASPTGRAAGTPRPPRRSAPPTPAGDPERARAGGAPQAGGPRGTAAAYAKRVVALANAERAKAGCSPLRINNRLQAAAQAHANDMSARNYYEHNSPDGRDAGDRMESAGYEWRTWGENIHRGPDDPTGAVRDWMDSPGHRENILNCSFRDIGVGVNLNSNGPWWVQNFGVSD